MGNIVMKMKMLMMVVLVGGMEVKEVAAQECPHREYAWTHTVGGKYFENAVGLAIDAQDNIYVAGLFEDRVDFNPFKGRANRDRRRSKGADDIYLTSYGPNGSYRWTVTMGADSFDCALGVAITPSNKVVFCGAFDGRFDFDPTEGKDKHKSNGNGDAFVTLLHTDRSYGWTVTFGGVGSEVARTITSDVDNNILVAGTFSSETDFDPGPGENIKRPNTDGYRDIFVSKFTENGSYLWTQTWGGIEGDYAFTVATDLNGNVYIGGQFSDTVDFDPTDGEDIRTSNGKADMYLTSLGPDGAYRWTRTVGGTDNDAALSVAVDGDGHVYLSGHFSGVVDFDSEGNGDIHDATGGGSDAFVTKRGTDGSYLWTKSFGAETGGAAADVTLGSQGQVVLAGGFSNKVDFDPGDGVDEHTSQGRRDIFVTRLTADGEHILTDTFGSTGGDGAFGAAVDTQGNVLVAGDFDSDTVDFDPTAAVDEHTNHGSFDFFVTKFNCGECLFVDRHDLIAKTGKLTSIIYTTAPGGKIEVQCKGPDGKITNRKTINSEGMVKVPFKNLPPGMYTCAIKSIKDSNDQTLCKGNFSKRTATVE